MKDLNTLVIRHSYCDSNKSPSHGHLGYLIDFLKERYGKTSEILHPFVYSEYYNSQLILHNNRANERTILKEIPTPKIPEILFYVKDFIATIVLVLFTRKRFHVAIGADPLNALSAVFLKKLGLADTTVFYVIDYTPKRFDNPLLNYMYQSLCRISAKRCDYIWNLTKSMAEVWAEDIEDTKKNIVVPGGVESFKKERRILEDSDKRLIYFGHLVESKGIRLVLEAFPEILKQVPDCELLIVGTGDLEGEMKQLAIQLGINDNVRFLGFVPEYEDILEIISECDVGLAPYLPSEDTFTRYADPLKPKEYMSCGLPVIITDVPEIAREIEEMGAGIVIEYASQELADAAISLLTDAERYKSHRGGVRKLSSKYTWAAIFEEALKTTLVNNLD